jgi:hypothetical protein
MILAHSLLWGKVAEHMTLLLIASSHACWMRSALLRYKLLKFFSNLLGFICKVVLGLRNRFISGLLCT